tara:strand:+ start:215 stop:457 length:243 start_codon:yes stop_codon:yes gene_type:complete
MFTVKTLTKYLMTIEDQNLPVKVCIDDTKLQLKKISLNNTGYGSWDQGEIRLIGKEAGWKSKKEKEWEKDEEAASRKLQA